jgi:tetratricopeptide (TPR) repeat protein
MRSSFAKYTLLAAFLLALLLGMGSNVHAAPPPQDADATLRLINESEQTICYVLIFPVTSDEWGDDWLREDETIPPGGTRFFNLPSGPYNVLLADCEGNTLLAEGNVVVSELHELRFNACKVLNLEDVGLLGQAHYPEALRKLQDALACYREAGDRAGERTTLNNIGLVYESKTSETPP